MQDADAYEVMEYLLQALDKEYIAEIGQVSHLPLVNSMLQYSAQSAQLHLL